jgi:acylphosphatase
MPSDLGEPRPAKAASSRGPAIERAVRMRIRGRVQGVGYRAWARRRAASLGLRGWVRNRSDGSVELLAVGATEAVAAMVDAARRGPPAAAVAEVNVAPAEDDGSVGFTAALDW